MVSFCKFAKCGFGVHFCGFGVHFCGFGVIFAASVCVFAASVCARRLLPATTLPAFAAPAAGLLQPQRAVPDHRRARPLAFSRRLSARKAAHTPRTQPSARHHPRAGTSRRVGALVRLNAELRSDLRRGSALPMAATGAAPPPACCLCLSQPCDPSANAHLKRDVRSRCDWQHSRR